MTPLPKADASYADAAGQRLIDHVRALRRRWWVVALVTGLVTAVAVIVSLSSPKKYDASAQVLLSQSEPVNQLLNPNATGGSNDVERDVNTKVNLIKLDAVANQVRARLRLRSGNDELLREVSTKVKGNSDIVSITVRDTKPTRAARIADAFADAYVSFRQTSARKSIEDAVNLAQNQLNALSPDARNSAEGQQLQSRLRELQIAATLQTGGVEIVRRATVPTSPSRPRPLLSAFLGIVLGLILAVALALILEFLDRRLKDEEAVEQIYEVPIIASVPRASRRAGQIPGDDPNQREAYGMLAANLRFSSLSAESNVLMITSPGPEEGKTSVTLGLARALALLGQRVIAIEADLRRPAFSRYGHFRPQGSGLVEMVMGSRSLSEGLAWIDATTFAPVTQDGLGDAATFAIAPAGPVPTNPQSLLARPAMGQLLKEARALADVVLIDTAPVGTVNDAVTLTAHVDGVVIVSRLNKTTKDAARRTLRLLRQFDLQLPGVVITDAEIPAEGYYYGPRPTAPAEESLSLPAA